MGAHHDQSINSCRTLGVEKSKGQGTHAKMTSMWADIAGVFGVVYPRLVHGSTDRTRWMVNYWLLAGSKGDRRSNRGA